MTSNQLKFQNVYLESSICFIFIVSRTTKDSTDCSTNFHSALTFESKLMILDFFSLEISIGTLQNFTNYKFPTYFQTFLTIKLECFLVYEIFKTDLEKFISPVGCKRQLDVFSCKFQKVNTEYWLWRIMRCSGCFHSKRVKTMA